MMTAQQQLDAFLADCTQIRAGYFFSFKKRSSSLRHFIGRLETQIKTNAVKALTQQDFDRTECLGRHPAPLRCGGRP